MSLEETWKGLCTPAQIYAVLALIVIVGMAYKQQYGPIIAQAIFAAIWTFVLGWICTKGWTWVSWVLVLLPVILAVGFIIFIVVMGKNVSGLKAVPENRDARKSEQQKVKEYFYTKPPCDTDHHWSDESNRCVSNQEENEYFTDENKCPNGMQWNGQTCVKDENEYFYAEEGGCPEGQTYVDGECV